MQDLSTSHIVHFDIKSDNILLEPLPEVSENEFWHPNPGVLPFRIVLADFGESKQFANIDGATTVR